MSIVFSLGASLKGNITSLLYLFLIQNDFASALNIFNKILNKYNLENLLKTNSQNMINCVETNAEFNYFKEFFVNLFALKNKENKIKKCFFEIKNCLHRLGLNNEAYKVMENCYEMFPGDIVVGYELLKQSISVSTMLIFYLDFKFSKS